MVAAKKQMTFKTFSGIVSVIALLLIAVFIFCVYNVQNFQPWGMSGVAVQGRYMTFVDPELEYIFDQQNFIIESNNTPIFIRVRKEGQHDQGYVQIFEDAHGIAFNSMDRTQVDFVEYIDDRGDVYTKIRIREPRGMMTRTARVFINLKHENVVNFNPRVGVDLADAGAGYNFILNTGRSPVVFDFDDAASDLVINRLDVRGTGSVSIAKPAKATLNYLLVDSSNANVAIGSPVQTMVNIRGNSSNISLGEINSLDVQGDRHRVHATSVTASALFNVKDGSLSVSGVVGGNIIARGENLSISAMEVDNLDVRNLENNPDSIFTQTITSGSVSISRVNGNVDVRMESGSLTLGTRGSNENGELGVYGDVNVIKRLGGASVTFANCEEAVGSCIIWARDGMINVWGVRGYVNIQTVSAGTSDVSVAFADVFGNSRIWTGGSHEPNTAGRRITVTFINNAGAQMHVVGTSGIIDNVTPIDEQGDDEHANCRHPREAHNAVNGCRLFQVNGGGNILNIFTANTLTINRVMI